MQTQSVRSAGDLPPVFLEQIGLKSACKGNMQPQMHLAAFIAAFIGTKDECIGILGLLERLDQHVFTVRTQKAECSGKPAAARASPRPKRCLEAISRTLCLRKRHRAAVRQQAAGEFLFSLILLRVGERRTAQNRQAQAPARSIAAVFAVAQKRQSKAAVAEVEPFLCADLKRA